MHYSITPHELTARLGLLPRFSLAQLPTPLQPLKNLGSVLEAAELWMKLAIHELQATIRHLQNDALDPCFKILARVHLTDSVPCAPWPQKRTESPRMNWWVRGSVSIVPPPFRSISTRA